MCSLKLTNRFNINWFVHLRCCLIGANFEWAEPYVYQALVLFTEKSYGLLYAWRKVVPCRRVTPNTELLWASSNYSCILVPRDCDHFGQHQESQPLGRSNFSNENTWFADFLSLCACSESSRTNRPDQSDLLRIRNDYSAYAQKIEPFQMSRFFVLTKRSAASRDKNGLYTEANCRDI